MKVFLLSVATAVSTIIALALFGATAFLAREAFTHISFPTCGAFSGTCSLPLTFFVYTLFFSGVTATTVACICWKSRTKAQWRTRRRAWQ